MDKFNNNNNPNPEVSASENGIVNRSFINDESDDNIKNINPITSGRFSISLSVPDDNNIKKKSIESATEPNLSPVSRPSVVNRKAQDQSESQSKSETQEKSGSKMVSPQEDIEQHQPIVNYCENNSLSEFKKPKDPKLWRDLLAFWILGLCNNYGYVVMLGAADDIIAKFNHNELAKMEEIPVESGRLCHITSTGIILLADIIPALLTKIVAPFFPLWVNFRVFVAIVLCGAGFLLVGFAEMQWMAILGVIFTSISSGLGETSFLAYSAKYNKNVVSTWSSGTGAAGIAGALSYALLKSFNVPNLTIMLVILFFPILEGIAFWIILRSPTVQPMHRVESNISTTTAKYEEDIKPLCSLKEKLKYMIYLLKYSIPLFGVYFAEYFINQGLFELVYFENTFLDKASQYRWLFVDYQIGVFISRSTVNLYSVNKIWLLTLFQFINVVYFLIESIFYVTPSIWIVFVVVFWEGLLGGGAYVNTFYKISKEVHPVRRQFAMGVVTQADSVGITLAGLLAIPVHNIICGLIKPVRPIVW